MAAVQKPERWLIINSLTGGGAERQALLLLNQQVFDKIILLEQNVDYKDIDVSKIVFLTNKTATKGPLLVLTSLFAQYKQLRQLISYRDNNSRPLQIVSMLFRADLLNFICSRFLSYPFISSFRSSITGFPKKSIQYIGWKWILRHSTRVLPNSNHCADELVELGFCSREQIRVIQNGYDIPLIHTQAGLNNALLLKDKKYFLAAGRLGNEKGYFFLISVFAHFVQTVRKDIGLIICGAGPLMQPLIDYATLQQLTVSTGDDFTAMKNIHFAGFQKNIYPLLHKAELFIMSSIFEGIPNVVAESLICGTPVVCSANKGTVELLAPNNAAPVSAEKITTPLQVEGGYLMPLVEADRPANPSELDTWVKTLQQALASSSDSARQTRFASITNRLSAENCAAGWTKVLDELATHY